MPLGAATIAIDTISAEPRIRHFGAGTLPSRRGGKTCLSGLANSTAPPTAHAPNILNLRQLLGDRRLARRLQAARCPLTFKDRAVSSIASDVNSTSSFAQSASQQRPSAAPTAQQTDSQPFTA